MPHGRSARTQQTCRCPSCHQEFTIEEGQKCTSDECPLCWSIAIGPPPAPPKRGRPRTQKVCRCPSCCYIHVIEEGQRCQTFECPECGDRMVNI